jgi:2C-methyl-D-erythritol 2,4-cyclodiphosphate synthase
LSKRTDPSPKSVSEVLAKLSEKNYAFNFDVTLELNTPKLQVGNVRIHGRVESAAKK